MEQLRLSPPPRHTSRRALRRAPGRAPRRTLVSLGILAPFILSVAIAHPAVGAEAAPPAAAQADEALASSGSCVRLGPDSRVKVTGTFRVQNAGCAPGGWRTVSGPTWLDLTDGEYVEARGPGSSCTTQGGRPGTPKGGSSFCGPAWETRNDPIPGW